MRPEMLVVPNISAFGVSSGLIVTDDSLPFAAYPEGGYRPTSRPDGDLAGVAMRRARPVPEGFVDPDLLGNIGKWLDQRGVGHDRSPSHHVTEWHDDLNRAI